MYGPEGARIDIPGVGKGLRKYYKMLFAKKVISRDIMKELLDGLAQSPILKAAHDKLELDITEDEIADVMENLPFGKQAGPDRIPNAVYRCLSKHFAPKLTAVVLEAQRTGKLPKTMLQGDIGLIHKKDDTRLCGTLAKRSK